MILARCMLVLLFVCPLVESLSFGQNKANLGRALTAVRTNGSIKIDGRLTEPVWQRIGETGFVQRTPDENSPASQKTEVLVAYDQSALYVAVKMFDTRPDSIVGRLARRDQDSQSDLVMIGIDAAHDKRTGYYFGVNPAGSIQDGTLSNDTQTDNSWDGVWDVGVRMESWGWVAEFRIPYSQLRFPKHDKYVWSIDSSNGETKNHTLCTIHGLIGCASPDGSISRASRESSRRRASSSFRMQPPRESFSNNLRSMPSTLVAPILSNFSETFR
jgi:hypothetical protein